ncbi:MAG: NAD-dependent epimerase/dehydratase family protein [Kiritimatiellae bacterium]|nr:NAD-dependent epimerase/dehydratase family protein [Kiritimatiellia bacterium]
MIPEGTRVLVTGGTGLTGSYVLRELCRHKLDVHAIVRDPKKTGPFDQLPITWHVGQVYDQAVVRDAMEGTRVVLHIAAAYREPGIKDQQYYDVHVLSTQLLAEAALAQPGFQRFVHVSTVGVHGHIEHPPADESAPFAPGDVYQRTKAEAEIWIRALARDRGLPCAVIRPAGIYGPGDKRLLKVFKLAAKPVFPILGHGKCLYHLIHAEDLARAIITAGNHPEALGEVFICGDPEPVSLEWMGRIIADELKRPLRVVRLPVGPFMVAAHVCEAVCKPLGIAPPLYPRRVAFFTKDRAFNTAKLRERLGFTYLHTTEQGLRETTRWYREQGWL